MDNLAKFVEDFCTDAAGNPVKLQPWQKEMLNAVWNGDQKIIQFNRRKKYMTGCPFHNAAGDQSQPLNKKIENVPMPARIAALPRDERGFPIPYFATWIDGKADFRVVDPRRIAQCHNQKRCWVCGEQLGTYKAFVIGPMCMINRVSSEPPSHLECGVYAAKACPFLTQPKMRRNDKDLPEGHGEAAGIMVKRNPGVSMVWSTKKYNVFPTGDGGALFRVGDPENIGFYREGRKATLDEVLESITTGLPTLMAAAKLDGPDAEKMAQDLADQCIADVKKLYEENANATV